jgi:hypothetical protein
MFPSVIGNQLSEPNINVRQSRYVKNHANLANCFLVWLEISCLSLHTMPGGDRRPASPSLAHVRLVSPSLFSVYCFNGSIRRTTGRAPAGKGRATQATIYWILMCVSITSASLSWLLATDYSTPRRMLQLNWTAVGARIKMSKAWNATKSEATYEFR